MDGIKTINSHNQNNNSNYYQDKDEHANSEEYNKKTFELAEVLKTGYQKRKFSNTSTLNWLQTWRISNL
tara:strand:+ start:572 stop:778 length:207 start_codon:yes stop_codon:yes gene_type:complete